MSVPHIASFAETAFGDLRHDLPFQCGGRSEPDSSPIRRPHRKSDPLATATPLPLKVRSSVAPAIRDQPREERLTPPASALGKLLLMTAPLIVSDLLAIVLSGVLGTVAVYLSGIQVPERYRAAMPFMLVPLVIGYGPWGLYRSVGLHPVVELRELSKLNTIAFLATLIAGIVTGAPPAWQLFFTVGWLASLGLVPFLRALTRPNCASHRWWGYPVLVISSQSTARKIVQLLLRGSYSGLRPSAVVAMDFHHGGDILGVPLLNRTSSINSFIRMHGIRHCVIALPDLPQAQVMEVIDRYRAQIPYLMVLSASSNMPLLWGTSLDCGGMGGIGVQNGLMLATPRLVKRALDIALSATVILAGLPLFALVALLVKVSSRGPIFFGHQRLGFGGKSFRAWKFRTMRPNADKLLKKYLDKNPDARAEWEESFKLRKDPRVTLIGRFLRKSSLDEFPQLWNVIRGEMSLVGPRPIISDEAEKYGRVFKLYTDVKPGITGLWQVSGRNNTSYEERVQLDNYYVRNWSPWLDIHILARTVSTLVRGNGAY